MLEDKDRIFKNLYNDFGVDVTSSKNRDDWLNTKVLISHYDNSFTMYKRMCNRSR